MLVRLTEEEKKQCGVIKGGCNTVMYLAPPKVMQKVYIMSLIEILCNAIDSKKKDN